MAEAILSQGAQAAPTTLPASTVSAIREMTHEALSLGDALQYLADSEHEAMPSGLACVLRVLADRAHAIGGGLDGIKLGGRDDE
jgi:hypothetical protein